MKNFLVFLHCSDPAKVGKAMDLLMHEHTEWGGEYDANVYFVTSELNAKELQKSLVSEAKIELGDVCYVIELGATFAATGNAKTIEQLSQRSKML